MAKDFTVKVEISLENIPSCVIQNKNFFELDMGLLVLADSHNQTHRSLNVKLPACGD